MIKTKKQMFIIIGVFALVMLLGEITYAFFNYTRTGTANVIRTGQINFATTQTSGQNGSISLTNVFPVDVSEGVPSNDPNVGEVTINITGNTEYTGGIEYLVSATNVTNTIGNKTIPIGVNITATSGLGTSDDDYFTDKENNPETSIYKVLAGDTIEDDTELVVGYIKSGETGVNGNIVIKAYIDADKVAISDTYYENVTATPTPTAPTDEYGTTTEWVDDRVVLTTTEWNQLQSSGVSFKVKVEANEGTWVVPIIPSCPGCKFIYTENQYFYSANNYNSSPISTLTTFANNNETLVEDYRTLNKNNFLGFKFDGSGNITNAYSCGIKGTDYLNNEEQNPGVNAGTAFCIEGNTDGSTWTTNQTFLNDQTTGIWQGRCVGGGFYVNCTGSVNAYAYSTGNVNVVNGDINCRVYGVGFATCD